jgi:hypothetical protein
MKRICISEYHEGNRLFGYKEPLEDDSETHGLCDQCFRKEMIILMVKNYSLNGKKLTGGQK